MDVKSARAVAESTGLINKINLMSVEVKFFMKTPFTFDPYGPFLFLNPVKAASPFGSKRCNGLSNTFYKAFDLS